MTNPVFLPQPRINLTTKGVTTMASRWLRMGMAFLVTGFLATSWQDAHAVGTVAGTTITNNATASYSVGGVPATATTSTLTD